MYTDSGKKFIQLTFQSNFKLQFEEIIISLKFCPRCARTRGFSRDIFATHFVGFPFSFFLPLSFIFFTLFVLQGFRAQASVFTVFWPFGQRNWQTVEEVWTI